MKQEFIYNTSQQISRRRVAVPPRILEPRENRKPFGTSKSPKKPARQERSKISTQRQERRPLRLLVDQAEEKNQTRSRGSYWKDFLTTSEPPPKTLEKLRDKRTLKNGAEPSDKCPDWIRPIIQRKKISKFLKYTL